jgi:hypothetical protein
MRLPVDVMINDLKLVLTRFADDPSPITYNDLLSGIAEFSDIIADTLTEFLKDVGA